MMPEEEPKQAENPEPEKDEAETQAQAQAEEAGKAEVVIEAIPMPEATGRKPYISRLLNRFGIKTSPAVDWWLDWLQVLAVAALLAWVVMTFVVVRMRVPTGSMEPTIMAGSSFFVDKISYYFREPKPGDIIVFWHEENGKKVRYVKRLIAVGGQTVQIGNDGRVYVDGKALIGPAFDRTYYQGGKMGDQPWTVPEDHYFVLGDNSRNSLDSRYWGFVNKKDFIGEPFLRVWPPSQFGFMNGYLGSKK